MSCCTERMKGKSCPCAYIKVVILEAEHEKLKKINRTLKVFIDRYQLDLSEMLDEETIRELGES